MGFVKMFLEVNTNSERLNWLYKMDGKKQKTIRVISVKINTEKLVNESFNVILLLFSVKFSF